MKMFAKLKRVLACVLTAAMLTAMLTACGGGGSISINGSIGGTTASAEKLADTPLATGGNVTLKGTFDGESIELGSNGTSTYMRETGTGLDLVFLQTNTGLYCIDMTEDEKTAYDATTLSSYSTVKIMIELAEDILNTKYKLSGATVSKTTVGGTEYYSETITTVIDGTSFNIAYCFDDDGTLKYIFVSSGTPAEEVMTIAVDSVKSSVDSSLLTTDGWTEGNTTTDPDSSDTTPSTFSESKTAQIYKQLSSGYSAEYTVTYSSGTSFDMSYVTDFEWEYEKSTYSDGTKNIWLMCDPDWYELDEDNKTYTYCYQPTDGEFVNGFIIIPDYQQYATLDETGTAGNYYYERVTYINDLDPVDMTYCYNSAGVLKMVIFDMDLEADTYSAVYEISSYSASYDASLLTINGYTDAEAKADDEIAINETNFPDDTFRSYVSSNFDKDSSGGLSESEIANVTEINIAGDMSVIEDFSPLAQGNLIYYGTRGDVSSLEGIKYFTSLQTLDCSGNQITSLDLRYNTNLKLLNCGGNYLTNLNLRGNSKLESLYCIDTSLTSLDVSQNTKLKLLQCNTCLLTSLNVSCNPALTLLECSDNPFESLDVSHNTALRTLICKNVKLSGLSLINNLLLSELDLEGSLINELDVSKLPALTVLNCATCNLTTLDISKNTKLKELTCSTNLLTSLDVSNNTLLEGLYCQFNELTELDVSKNTALENLYCDSSVTVTGAGDNVTISHPTS